MHTGRTEAVESYACDLISDVLFSRGCRPWRASCRSLGVLLYIMLSGRPPFQGPTDIETLKRIMVRTYQCTVSHRPPCVCFEQPSSSHTTSPHTPLASAPALRSLRSRASPSVFPHSPSPAPRPVHAAGLQSGTVAIHLGGGEGPHKENSHACRGGAPRLRPLPLATLRARGPTRGQCWFAPADCPLLNPHTSAGMHSCLPAHPPVSVAPPRLPLPERRSA